MAKINRVELVAAAERRNLMMLQERKLASIEIQLTTAASKFTFPNDNFLNGKTITMFWLPDNDNTDIVAPSGRPVAANNVIMSANFTVRKDSDSKVLDVPLAYFLESWYGGDRRTREVWIEGFNPGTTFVNFPDTGVIDTDTSILFMVEYIDC